MESGNIASRDAREEPEIPAGFVNVAEIRRRFPIFNHRHLHAWCRLGHPALDDNLQRISVCEGRRFLYNLDQLEKINAYWEKRGGSRGSVARTINGYINTAEILRRFPRFTGKQVCEWWKLGHPAIEGRLRRIEIPGRKRYYLYDLEQLSKINAYWDEADRSETPESVPDKDGSPCLRADFAAAQYGWALAEFHEWSAKHCPWLDESRNSANGHRTHHRLRAIKGPHFGKHNKRRYEVLYFRVDQLDEIKRNRGEWKTYREAGWLLWNEVGKDQGILAGAFRGWRENGFPPDSPIPDSRLVLWPTAEGRSKRRVIYSPDGIKRLAEWLKSVPRADDLHRDEDGSVYRTSRCLLRRFQDSRLNRPCAPPGKTGRRIAHALTEQLLRKWRESGCDELAGEILDTRLVTVRTPTGQIRPVRVYKTNQVEKMIAARRGEHNALIAPADARGDFIYRERLKGTAWAKILVAVNQHTEWEPLFHISGVRSALRRHVDKFRLSKPQKGKSGRPIGNMS